MGRRILLHPGFHKTGTSSAQHFLWHNRERLAPVARLYLLRHLRLVADAAMRYARKRQVADLVAAAGSLTEVLADAPGDRHLVLSCEGLSGHIPGWPDVADYGAAAEILPVLVQVLRESLSGHECHVVLTTRAPEAWLSSAWRHLLIGTRLREDWPVFARRYHRAADLDGAARRIASALAPLPVTCLPLERAREHPLGPGGALLELAGLSSEGLLPVGHGNRGPDADLARELLALNRSGLTTEDLKARKQALCASRGVGGWVRGNG
ncbi:hypothetical protein [Histidinibacterium lentulum]|uniref:Sulfotransferase family protein n=1 Tax=Histidinibacterium lentulum TaxID=2480588 RepID=A0A3N2QVX4_9RHOB|nr:hypothetical protein [Histidinibacterium lentulum]ROT99391.1 hypothetical protein EAT49_14325 [Histidinibacterium lentulum]